MRHRKPTPRAEYRQQQSFRANESPSLSEKFRELKSLTAELTYFNREGIAKNGEIKYTLNPDHARSVVRFECRNDECIGGDFDLSEVLSQAVATHEAASSGEMSCQGWVNETPSERVHCHSRLRYKLTLGY